jgi:hypothetical protein
MPSSLRETGELRLKGERGDDADTLSKGSVEPR